MHPGTNDPTELALHIQKTRKTPRTLRGTAFRSLPFDLGFALCIGIGETQVGQGDANLVTISFPLHIAAHLVQQNTCFVKNAWQIDMSGFQGQLRLPPGLVEIEVNIGPAESGASSVSHRARGNLQLSATALDGVEGWFFNLPLPARLHLLHQPLGGQLGQRFAQCIVHRQTLGNLRHGSQIEPVPGELAIRRLSGVASENR